MERRRGSGEDRHVDRGGDRGGTRNKDTWYMSVKEEAKFFDKREKKKIFFTEKSHWSPPAGSRHNAKFIKSRLYDKGQRSGELKVSKKKIHLVKGQPKKIETFNY